MAVSFQRNSTGLLGCSTGADPTADSDSMVGYKSRGQKSMKRAGKIWVGFHFPNRMQYIQACLDLKADQTWDWIFSP